MWGNFLADAQAGVEVAPLDKGLGYHVLLEKAERGARMTFSHNLNFGSFVSPLYIEHYRDYMLPIKNVFKILENIYSKI